MKGAGQLPLLVTLVISSCASTAELTADLKMSLGIGNHFKTQWFLWLGRYSMPKYISQHPTGNLRMWVYIENVKWSCRFGSDDKIQLDLATLRNCSIQNKIILAEHSYYAHP